MGLDMYLNAKRYVSGWDHDSDAEKAQYQDLLKLWGLDKFTCEGSPHGEISLCVAYWRKANAIHRWFVEKCQDGKDECQTAYITRDQLGELLALCKEVKANKGKAEETLPTQSGFFFGSTAYDEDYERDIDDTIAQLEAVLTNPAFQHCDFYYHASW